jgi:transcription initiation factor TFIID TATA-box-binding protein
MLKICNITAKFCVKISLDINLIRTNFPEITSPIGNKFRGLVFRIPSPKSTFLIFENGKIVCVGARDHSHALHGARVLVKLIKTIYPKAKLNNFKINNIVTHAHMTERIDLVKLYYAFPSRCFYEPELFPGLKFTLVEPKAMVLIFHTGKVIITGVRTLCNAKLARDYIMGILADFVVSTS